MKGRGIMISLNKLSILISILFLTFSISFAHLNDGLVAYYTFNGNAIDESGNGADVLFLLLLKTDYRFCDNCSILKDIILKI